MTSALGIASHPTPGSPQRNDFLAFVRSHPGQGDREDYQQNSSQQGPQVVEGPENGRGKLCLGGLLFREGMHQGLGSGWLGVIFVDTRKPIIPGSTLKVSVQDAKVSCTHPLWDTQAIHDPD